MPQALEQADGRWAWVVLLASLVAQGLTVAFPSCMGVFFTDLQRDFQASNSETSWFPALMVAMLHTGGPLCSVLVKRFGCRVTMMLGGILASLGMVASSFSGSLYQLFLTAGLITGLGMCFSFQSSITVLGLYFVQHRPLANALASMGMSMGVTLWPLLARYLLETLGWRGAFLIFGGVFLHCCVCGAILRPVATNMVPEPKEDPPLPPKTPARSCLATCVSTIQHHLAFDILWHNMGFCIYVVGMTCMHLGFPLPHIFLVPYAMHHGMDEYWAAMLTSVVGFCNIFLRPAAALLAGRKSLAASRKYLFTVAILVNGLTNLICTVSADFRVLLSYCLVYSLSMCGIGILIFQVLMDVVPMDRFPSALGLSTVLAGVASLVSPPLAGLLLDMTNNFSYVFYMSSCFLISASLFMAAGFYAAEKKQLKQEGKAKVEDAASEMTPMQGLTSGDKDSARKKLCPANMDVTNV
ncbi:monocarboxylate transporter 6 isoform X1 [Meriones unguiculatus]|uniref:monocarboxylate transporter 6 isoform X1 n=2 Tax=Meriones unguiculatus TaxID=10047 RepID=UPI000B4F4536|nr:monocarboxylate transporter 6 isoform X1 [Meriones unguiculatus]